MCNAILKRMHRCSNNPLYWYSTYYCYHRQISPGAQVLWLSQIIHHRPCGYFPCRQRASWLQAQELCGLHSDSFVLYLIINLKIVWLFIIIITNWDVDVLIDIVLQDIDMRQNVGLCTSPHYKHALQCNADEKIELGPYLVIK